MTEERYRFSWELTIQLGDRKKTRLSVSFFNQQNQRTCTTAAVPNVSRETPGKKELDQSTHWTKGSPYCTHPNTHLEREHLATRNRPMEPKWPGHGMSGTAFPTRRGESQDLQLNEQEDLEFSLTVEKKADSKGCIGMEQTK